MADAHKPEDTMGTAKFSPTDALRGLWHSLSTRILSALALLVAVASGTGCVYVYDGPEISNEPGDISFQWSFAGETRCASAGVDEVGVQILSVGGETLFEDVLDCQGGGLLVTDFLPGRYEIWLDAFNANGDLLYQGEDLVQVHPAMENDAGLLVLDRLVSEGALGLYWGFLYPTDRSDVYNCEVAGVYEVDVEVIPLSGPGEAFVETFRCDEEGLLIDHLPAGTYQVTLVAYGRYQGQDLALYESSLQTEVYGETTQELGDIMMERIFEGFSDFEVSWGFPAGSCDELGIMDVEIVLERLNPQLEEDVFVADCYESFVLRDTFVPGSYLIKARAMGVYGDYIGALTLSAPPNSTIPGHVQLVLE